MAYATRQDIEAVWGAEHLLDLLPDDVDPDVAIADGLRLASTEIDGHLSARYQLPLATTPATLMMPCANIAVFILANRHTALTETIETRYKAAVDLLKRIADGKAGLGADEPKVETGVGGATGDGAAFSAEPRRFTRSTP